MFGWCLYKEVLIYFSHWGYDSLNATTQMNQRLVSRRISCQEAYFRYVEKGVH